MLWYVIERNLILVNNAIGDYTTQFILVCYNAFRRFKQKYNLMQTSVEKFAPRLSKIKTQTIKCVNVFIRSYSLIVLVFVKTVEVHHLQIRIAISSEDIDLYFIDTQVKYFGGIPADRCWKDPYLFSWSFIYRSYEIGPKRKHNICSKMIKNMLKKDLGLINFFLLVCY